MNRRQRRRVRAITFSHRHHKLIHIEACALRTLQALVGVRAEPEAGQSGKNLQTSGCGRDCAYIVREQAVSSAMKMRCQRGLASALGSDKDHRAPGCLNRAAMQRKQPALVKERAHGRTKQEQAQPFSRDIGKRIDEDAASLLNAIKRNARHSQLEDPRLNFIRNLAEGFKSLSGCGQQVDGHIGIVCCVWKRRQLRTFQVRMDAKSISPVCMQGHRQPRLARQSKASSSCVRLKRKYGQGYSGLRCPWIEVAHSQVYAWEQ